MILLNTKNTYFSEDGKILSGGRLRFFKVATTTALTGYYDSDYQTPTGPIYVLNSAGSQSHEIYFSESVSVYVDQYLGLDEYGVDRWLPLYSFDLLSSVMGGGDGVDTFIDTIDALKALEPVTGMKVIVSGYNIKGDCPARLFYWDESSSETDNFGTIIESGTTPSGRWKMTIEGPYVDSRIFGVIPGNDPITANSNLSAFGGYCQSSKKIAYIPTGAYFLAGGGSLTLDCDMKVDGGVTFTTTSGSYNLNLAGKKLEFVDSFGGEGLIIAISGADDCTIPISIFHSGQTNLTTITSTGRFTLKVNQTRSVLFPYDYTFGCIYIDKDYVLTLTNNTETFSYFDKLEGEGEIDFESDLWMLDGPSIKLSNVTAGSEEFGGLVYGTNYARIFYRFTGEVIVDKLIPNCYSLWIADNVGTYVTSSTSKLIVKKSLSVSHTFDFKLIESVTGVMVGTYRLNQPINVNWFTSSRDAMLSYMFSPKVASIDMEGKTATSQVISKWSEDGTQYIDMEIYNCSDIFRVVNTGKKVRLVNCIINNISTTDSQYCVSSGSLVADDCKFYRVNGKVLFPALSSCYLTRCAFGTVADGNSVEVRVYSNWYLKGCTTLTASHPLYRAVPASGLLWLGCIEECVFKTLIFDASLGNHSSSKCKDFVVRNNIVTSSNDISAYSTTSWKWDADDKCGGFVVKDNWNTYYSAPSVATEGSIKIVGNYYATGNLSTYKIPNMPIFNLAFDATSRFYFSWFDVKVNQNAVVYMYGSSTGTGWAMSLTKEIAVNLLGYGNDWFRPTNATLDFLISWKAYN